MDPHPSVVAQRSGVSLSTLERSRPEFLPLKKGRNAGEIERLFAWDALAEVAGMAEGSAGMLLGKARPRKKPEDS